MRRLPPIRWLRCGAAIIALVIGVAAIGRAPIADPPRYGPPADALSTSARHLPAPYLAAAGLGLELPTTELGSRGPQPGPATRSTGTITTPARSISTATSAARMIQLRHDTFAADDLAARAGLLARTPAPPPPLG